MCKNLAVQHPLTAEIWFFEKVDFLGMIAPLNLCGLWTKVYWTLSPNAERNTVVK